LVIPHPGEGGRYEEGGCVWAEDVGLSMLLDRTNCAKKAPEPEKSGR